MKINRIAIMILLIGILVITAGCGGDNQNAGDNNADMGNTNMSNNTAANNDTEAADSGDDVEAMVISSDLLLDPALVAPEDVASLIISDYLYDTLVMVNDDGRVVPGLALTAEESDDGLTYVFTLRTDAVFYDGTHVTADVVIANFSRWFDPEHPLHGTDQDYFAWIEHFKGFRGELDADDKPISLFDGIEKTDPLTVLVHLNEPMPNFLEIISSVQFSILNPAALEADGYGGSTASVDGTGPYRITEWTDTGLTLSPNGDYWGEAAGEDLLFTFE